MLSRFLSILALTVLSLLAPLACAQEEDSPLPASTTEAATPTQPLNAGDSPKVAPPSSGAAAWLLKLKEGGSVVVFQFILSVVAGAYAVACFSAIKRERIVPDGLARRAMDLWNAGKMDELQRLQDTHPSTLSRAITSLVKHRKNSVAEVSATTGDLAAGEISALLGKAYPIAVIANLEPLLGLLGTVFGMIDCFDMVAVAGELGDASLLASGISKALVTTAVGLVLAIPLLYIYHHFKSKVQKYATTLDLQVTRLTSEWFLQK